MFWVGGGVWVWVSLGGVVWVGATSGEQNQKLKFFLVDYYLKRGPFNTPLVGAWDSRKINDLNLKTTQPCKSDEQQNSNFYENFEIDSGLSSRSAFSGSGSGLSLEGHTRVILVSLFYSLNVPLKLKI